MTIPGFDAAGNLPPGAHRVTLREIEERFTWNRRRKRLFRGLAEASENLSSAGVRKIWVNGSFITSKNEPEDIDGCWEYKQSVDVNKLDTVFLDINPPRKAMKDKYGVDFLISTVTLTDAKGKNVLDFFQVDRNGNRKGILVVEIGER